MLQTIAFIFAIGGLMMLAIGGVFGILHDYQTAYRMLIPSVVLTNLALCAQATWIIRRGEG